MIKKLLFISFVFLLFLEVLLRLSGFGYLFFLNKGTDRTNDKESVFRIMCLGESTTALGGEFSYPQQLEKILNAKGKYKTPIQVINRGIPGTNSRVISTQLNKNLKRDDPHLVICMIGVNDDYHFKDFKGREEKLYNTFYQIRVYKLFRSLLKRVLLVFDQYLRSLEPLTNEELNDLGFYFQQQSNFNAARRVYHFLIEREKNKPAVIAGAYRELGNLYRDYGSFKKAEKMYQEAIRLFPEDAGNHAEIGNYYSVIGDYEKMELYNKKALALMPENELFYRMVQLSLEKQGKNQEVEELLLQFVSQVGTDEAYERLHRYYNDLDQLYKMETLYQELIQSSLEPWAFERLKEYYREQGETEKLEGLNQIKTEKNIQETNKSKITLEELQLSEGKKLHPYTVTAYREIINTTLLQGRKVVVVQYPVRSLKPLRNIFDRKSEIIFVDNEAVFKEAILDNGYETVFYDRYGKNFGHATRFGNQLLAENISKKVIPYLDTLLK